MKRKVLQRLKKEYVKKESEMKEVLIKNEPLIQKTLLKSIKRQIKAV